MDGDRRRPLAVAERTLETLQNVQVAGELAEPPLVVERIGEAFEVAARIVHVGFGDLDVVQADGGIDGEVARFGPLAYDLLVNLALGRHIDDESPWMSAEQPSRRPSARVRREA